MNKISLFGVFCLFFFLAKQVIATDHLTSSHKPSALSSQERTAEAFQLSANIEPSMLIAQAETSTQETDQGEFERRQQRIKELEVAIQKRMDTVQSKRAITEKPAAEKLSRGDTKSGLWKTLAIFAVVLLGLLTLLRIWWQNKQEKELEEQAIWETLEAADPDLSSSPTADSLASTKISTKHGADSSILSETESDPIAAAAIFLAFEQRARAIKVLKDALINDPAQADITAKLLTLYANDGNTREFTSLFESAADNIENEEQWSKIKSLAEATIPEHKIHAYDSNASVPILQDAIQDEEIESSEYDELDAIHASEEDAPEVIVNESTTIAQAQLTQADLPEANASNETESRPQEINPDLSQSDLKTTLALAKAYLDIGNDEAAIGFIIDVTNNDQGQLGHEAQLLLDSLDKDLLNRTISNQLNIKENQVPLSDLRFISEREVALEPDEGSAGEPDLDSPPTAAEPDDFDLNLDEELEEVNIHNPETALTLAKAYIDLGEDTLARDFLIDADATNNSEDKAEIKRLLAELDQKTSDTTQAPMEAPSDNEAHSNESLNTEDDTQAEQDAKREVEIITESKLGAPNSEPIIEQDSLAETKPDDATQHKVETQQPDSDSDVKAPATIISTPKETELEASSLLALAKSYIALEEYDLARKFLTQAKQIGHQAHGAEALQILSILDAGGNLDFIFNFEMLPSGANDVTIPVRDANGPLADDETKSKVDRTESVKQRKSEDGSSIDSEEILDDKISITESIATVDDSELKDLLMQDDPEFSYVDVKSKQPDELKTNEGRIDELYDIDHDSEIVELEPHDPATALELAKAYIELGDEETAREVLEDVARSDKEKCVLEARSILATLDAVPETSTVADIHAHAPAPNKNLDLPMQDDTSRRSETVSGADTQAVSSEPSSTPAIGDDDSTILIETEQHDPETAIELAYAYIELGEKKIAKNILQEVIKMDSGQTNIKVKAIAALNSIS